MTFNSFKNNQEKTVLVTLNGATASKRTKNKIRNNGPRFIQAFPKVNRPGEVFLKSFLVNGWTGWVPEKEIIIHELDVFDE
jgi:hypothetical protein